MKHAYYTFPDRGPTFPPPQTCPAETLLVEGMGFARLRVYTPEGMTTTYCKREDVPTPGRWHQNGVV